MSPRRPDLVDFWLGAGLAAILVSFVWGFLMGYYLR